jgi:hypothetical protein
METKLILTGNDASSVVAIATALVEAVLLIIGLAARR